MSNSAKTPSASSAAPLPAVAEQHRRAAFEAMAWTNWTYEQAMADDTRRRVVEARARQLRTAIWTATRRRIAREAFLSRQPNERDAKRAAAGDVDAV